jgi:zinc transporter ZupT
MIEEKPSNILPYVLLLALCFDGFFEGIAISVQDRWEYVLYVIIVILINKWTVGLSLGLALKKSNTDLKTFIRLIFLFALFAPLGILLGWFLKDNLMARAILLSMSSGAFLYASTSVVVIEEFTVTNYRYSKYFCFLFGGILTALIKILPNLN